MIINFQKILTVHRQTLRILFSDRFQFGNSIVQERWLLFLSTVRSGRFNNRGIKKESRSLEGRPFLRCGGIPFSALIQSTCLLVYLPGYLAGWSESTVKHKRGEPRPRSEKCCGIVAGIILRCADL